MNKCLGCMEDKEAGLAVCPHCGYIEGTPPKEIYHITPGTLLHEKYIVGRVLGYSGLYITYIGWDTTLGRKVAIKEFLDVSMSGETTDRAKDALARSIEETQLLTKFNQDDYDTFIENNVGYIVMEYLEGDTVKDLLNKNGVMPYERAKLIIVEILKILAEVNKEGIIHRDISPDNIFITNDNKIKLLDFGASSFHSKSLSVILKPGYAPVELYGSRGNQGPWSDIYATAATLYKMITGITIEESMERAVKDNVKTPAELGVDLPESANIAIMNALNIHAEMRTQSADDFIHELTSEDVVRIIDKPRVSDAGRIPLWLQITIASILSIAIIFAGLVLSGLIDIGWPPPPPPPIEHRVPDVLYTMMDEGEKILNEDGFAMMIADYFYDEDTTKGVIKEQFPYAGTRADTISNFDDKGRPIVYVIVSGGQENAKTTENAICVYCGSKSHTMENHPTKCVICLSTEHTTENHTCSVCGGKGHDKEKTHCDYCKSTHATGSHPCKICGGALGSCSGHEYEPK